MQGTEYCYVTVEEGGQGAVEVLSAALPGLITGLNFSKSMRWEPCSDLAFSRPVRWLLALHGAARVPFSVGSLCSGSSTRLLRTSSPPTAAVESAGAYAGLLAAEGIILDVEERRRQIWAGVTEAAQVGCLQTDDPPPYSSFAASPPASFPSWMSIYVVSGASAYIVGWRLWPSCFQHSARVF